ncbi:MAG TPA: amidohydrolase family protein [Trebonia sp.]|nr:amidohydrolase family protein [Trebonia sp.]
MRVAPHTRARAAALSCRPSGWPPRLTRRRPVRWPPRLTRRRPFRALRWCSTARVMFGSNWPVCLPGCGHDEAVAPAGALVAGVLVAGLSETERAAVFAGAAARVHGSGTSPQTREQARGADR